MEKDSQNSRGTSGWAAWFKLGIGVKRWLLILAVGAIIVGTGIASLLIYLGQHDILLPSLYRLLTLQFLPAGFRILIPLILGSVLIIIALLRLGTNLVAPFRRPGVDVASSIYSFTQRRRGPRIVAIGGGTGMPSLLRGLREYTSNITAIVTVADDGGSSGRLRRELGVLPPGDFRNNIAALAQDEELMTQVMQYRFGSRIDRTGEVEKTSELSGHAFGNLLLAALTGITGSFDEALVAAGRVLAVRGQVLPSTLNQVTLVAKIASDGNQSPQLVVGESAIPKAGGRVEQVHLEPADIPAYPPAVKAILTADLVILGPGSLYTSILPNVLVGDICQAIIHTKAKRLYVCNLATQPGETDNYTVADHVAAIERHVEMVTGERSSCIDLVLANNQLSIPPGTGGGYTVFVQPLAPVNVKMDLSDLVDEQQPWRHDSTKLARAVMKYV